MPAILLALGCALAYGAADVLGGVAARPVHVVRVLAIAAPAALTVQVLAVEVLGPSVAVRWSAAALGWGAASGAASVAASALLYRALALGPMGVLSPLTAVVSAVLPVTVGLADGERPPILAAAGIPLALVAIVLVTAGHGDRWPSRPAVAFAAGAGVAIAGQLVCLQRAPADGSGATLLTARATACVVVLAAVAVAGGRLGAHPRAVPALPALAAGALDAVAGVAFLLAVRAGSLAVVAVVVSLSPAATVLLARTLLAERMVRSQVAGLGVAAVAVGLLAVS